MSDGSCDFVAICLLLVDETILCLHKIDDILDRTDGIIHSM